MSETAFPINDLLRRKLQTGLTITILTTCVASTLFLLLFSGQVGFGIAAATQNTLTIGISNVFSQFLLFIGALIFAVGSVIVSFVVFLMTDGDIIVCEGRGYDRDGAHTYGHNTDGIGVALEGNFDLSVDVTPYQPTINTFLASLRGLFANLATIDKHQDFSQTGCPGKSIIDVFSGFALIQPKEDNMALDQADKQYIYDEIQKGVTFLDGRIKTTAEDLAAKIDALQVSGGGLTEQEWATLVSRIVLKVQ